MAEKNMITNLWGFTKLVCGNHPNESNPPELVLKQTGKMVYYGCPTYSPKRPNDSCRNAITTRDYEKMLEYLSDKINSAYLNLQTINLTNHQWQTNNKKITFKVIEHNNFGITIMVTNKEVIQGGKLR